MTAVRFHRELYAGSALDQAIELYAKHADVSRADDGEHVVVTIASAKPGRAEKVARELGNYALGLTIQTRGGAAGAR